MGDFEIAAVLTFELAACIIAGAALAWIISRVPNVIAWLRIWRKAKY